MDFSKLYDSFYNKHGADVHLYPARFTKTAELCRGAVLDIGCGTAHLADYYPGEYCGVDISRVALSLARASRRKDASFFRQDMREVAPHFSKKFDTIVMAEFLEHVENDEIIFQNIENWWHNKTRLIISVPNGPRVPDPTHLREFTIPELRARFSKMGKVQFYNWEGAKGRIIMTVDLGEKNEHELSLVIMAKNEALGIDRAVLSCIDFIDEVVISIDEADTENTSEIARLYADKLLTHKWINDFSATRNEIQKAVSTSWIVTLDGHEFVKNSANIREKIKTDADALIVRVEMENKTSFVYPRIYRKEVQYKNAIHNLLKGKKDEAFSDFLIIHDRHGGQSEKANEIRNIQRNEMHESILTENIKKDPKDARSLFYLARFRVDQYKWQEALDLFEKYLEVHERTQSAWHACYMASVCAMGLQNTDLALAYLERADLFVPKRWEIAKRKAVIYFVKREFKNALSYFTESLALPEKGLIDKPEIRKKGETLDMIAVCYFNLGNYTQALENWENAQKENIDDLLKMKIENKMDFVRREHIDIKKEKQNG